MSDLDDAIVVGAELAGLAMPRPLYSI